MHYPFIIEDYTYFPIKDFKQTGKITVDPIFTTISTIISPPMQEAKIPTLIDFRFSGRR